MKLTYIILLLTLIFASCKDDSYFYEATEETVDMSIWDYLETDSSHSYFMELVAKHNLRDTINANNPITLFIPADDKLQALDTTDAFVKGMLSYIVAPTLINVQSMTTSSKIQTLLSKFALLEYDIANAQYAYDGKLFTNSSPLFNDGRFYDLEDVVLPAPNLYEYISVENPVFKGFIDLQDSTYFDVAASTPIDFGPQGTIYDSVFTTVNLFYEYYFPVDEEFRYKTSTFLLLTQAQLDSALDVVKKDLDIEEIPEEWQNEILLPNLINNSIFRNSLQYEEFVPEMKNIKGEDIIVDVDNIDEDSRYICSNGIVFNMIEYVVPEELYKEPKIMNGYEATSVIIEGDKWRWSSDVTVEGSTVEPTLVTVDEGALNTEVLTLNLGLGFQDTFRLTFTQKGVFGADKYRLLWSGSSTYCGLYRVYINGEALQMHNYAGKDQDYFDSFEFSNSIVKSVTDNGVYRKVGNFNLFDFEVTNIDEYTDVEITFEYIGPSLDSRGDARGTPGLVIDYFKLEIYE